MDLMQKVYVVQLSSEEREKLQELIKRGNRKKGQRPSALKLARARILLKADQAEDAPAYTDAEIAEALDVSPKTVFNLRKKWVELGLEQALERRPQPNRRLPKLDGKAEAKLVACSCGPPPKGLMVAVATGFPQAVCYKFDVRRRRIRWRLRAIVVHRGNARRIVRNRLQLADP